MPKPNLEDQVAAVLEQTRLEAMAFGTSLDAVWRTQAHKVVALAETHFRGAIADEIRHDAAPYRDTRDNGQMGAAYYVALGALLAAERIARGSVSPPLAGDPK